MASVNVGTIEVHVVSYDHGDWKILALQRSLTTRCPGSWEVVHGRIETGEQPEEAALREVKEETGLVAERLYNVTVTPFYLHRTHVVELSIVFAAFVDHTAAITLDAEHARYEWLSADAAATRLFWPAERANLRQVLHLFSSGDGGVADDVLRIR
jgi:dATP pyrophosphohydrolase